MFLARAAPGPRRFLTVRTKILRKMPRSAVGRTRNPPVAPRRLRILAEATRTSALEIAGYRPSDRRRAGGTRGCARPGLRPPVSVVGAGGSVGSCRSASSGSASVNTIERGYLYGAIAAFTCSCSSATSRRTARRRRPAPRGPARSGRGPRRARRSPRTRRRAACDSSVASTSGPAML